MIKIIKKVSLFVLAFIIWISINVLVVKTTFSIADNIYEQRKIQYNFLVEKNNILMSSIFDNLHEKDKIVLDLLKERNFKNYKKY